MVTANRQGTLTSWRKLADGLARRSSNTSEAWETATSSRTPSR